MDLRPPNFDLCELFSFYCHGDDDDDCGVQKMNLGHASALDAFLQHMQMWFLQSDMPPCRDVNFDGTCFKCDPIDGIKNK